MMSSLEVAVLRVTKDILIDLFRAISGDDDVVGVVQAVLETVTDVNATDDTGCTLLHHVIDLVSENEYYAAGKQLSMALTFVKMLLDRGASILISDQRGRKPILLAIQSKQNKILTMILKKMKNICICDVAMCTLRDSISASCPVHIQVNPHFINVVKICLDNQIDLSVHTSNGETLLILICKNKHDLNETGVTNVVRKLLTIAGHQLNTTDRRSYTALHYALGYQSYGVVKTLIEKGAYVNQASNSGVTPLIVAINEGKFQEFELVLQAGADVNAGIINNIFYCNVSPLTFGLLSNIKTEFIECLLRYGADIHRDELGFGFTPLHSAALKNNPTVFNHLLDMGCDVNVATVSGLTALHFASRAGAWKIVKILIERGVNVNIQEPTMNYTPLQIALMDKCDWDSFLYNQNLHLVEVFQRIFPVNPNSVISLLTDAGADVNSRALTNVTPLYYAIKEKNLYVVKKLIKLGASLDQLVDSQHTPLSMAMNMQNYDLINLLLRAGVDVNAPIVNNIIDAKLAPLTVATLSNARFDFIQSLVMDYGADINSLEAVFGLRPLHFATIANNLRLVDLMLDMGCDINCQSSCGLTALHLASGAGYLDIVNKLISRGASVDIREFLRRQTPLHIVPIGRTAMNRYFFPGRASACNHLLVGRFRRNRNLKSIISSLVDAGADVNSMDITIRTPLHYASLELPEFHDDYQEVAVKKVGRAGLFRLLKRGAHPNHPAFNFTVPLNNVIANLNTEGISYLLRWGADIHELQPNAHIIGRVYDMVKIYKYLVKLNIAELAEFNLLNIFFSTNRIHLLSLPCAEYRRELVNMRNFMIRGHPFFNWLMGRHSTFYLYWQLHQYQPTFPHYFDILRTRYHLNKERLALYNPLTVAVSQLAGMNIPYLVVRAICAFLTNKEIHFVILTMHM